jgi:hypothetical protein
MQRHCNRWDDPLCQWRVQPQHLRHATLLSLAILGSELTVATERRDEERKKGSLTAIRIIF